MAPPKTFEIPYIPQNRQKLLHSSTARQILYGGAAGGGKSVAMRWDIVLFALQNPGFVGALFRRTLPELRNTHINIIKAAIPTNIAKWNEEQKIFYFANGSRITMGFCESEDDVFRYLSEEYHAIYLDEGSRFTPKQIGYLKTRNRLGSWKPAKDKDKLPRFVIGTNPGGPSHSLLKRTIIDIGPPESMFYDETMRNPNDLNDRGWSTIFIPATMADNKYLDSDYASSFGGLPPELAKAYREGNWDVVVGQALHTLSREKHGLRPFVPPAHWTRFMVIDWGTAAPFSIGWYVVSEGGTLKGKQGFADRYMPAGAIIRYAELYGWNGKENEGCRWSGQRTAQKILELERERHEVKIDYRVGDTEMWAMRGGPAVIDYFQNTGLTFRRSIKDRKRNYQEIMCRLAGNEKYYADGTVEQDPMFFCTLNCRHFWRTVPILTLDETDPEKGPNTKEEDHVYDEVAYACRSYPYVTTFKEREDEEYQDKVGSFKNIGDPYATV